MGLKTPTVKGLLFEVNQDIPCFLIVHVHTVEFKPEFPSVTCSKFGDILVHRSNGIVPVYLSQHPTYDVCAQLDRPHGLRK